MSAEANTLVTLLVVFIA